MDEEVMRGERIGHGLEGFGLLSSSLCWVLTICHLDVGVTSDICLFCIFRLLSPESFCILFVSCFLSTLLVTMGSCQTSQGLLAPTWSLKILR